MLIRSEDNPGRGEKFLREVVKGRNLDQPGRLRQITEKWDFPALGLFYFKGF